MGWKTIGVREATKDAVVELVENAPNVETPDEYIRKTLLGPEAKKLLSEETVDILEELVDE